MNYSSQFWIPVILAIILIIGAAYYENQRMREERSAHLHCEKCNVILISLDTLGAKHTSMQTPTIHTTPFLQSLAERDDVAYFTHAYSQAPWTLPSHGSMLSGIYPWDLKLRHALDTLSTSTLLLSEALQNIGYETVAFSNGSFVQPFWGFNQGFNEFHSKPEESHWNDVPSIFDTASKWLQERSSEAPFFLFIHSFHAHDPYGNGDNALSIHDVIRSNTGTSTDTLTIKTFKDAYHKEIAEIDATLNTFFGTLSQSAYASNTILIITSDHGEEFGEHGTVGFHAVTLHNELLRVPLILFAPKSHMPDVDAPIEIRGIPGTIMEMTTGTAKPFSTSLVSHLKGRAPNTSIVRSATFLERSYLLDFLKEGYPSSMAYMQEYLAEHPLPQEQRSVIVENIHAIMDEKGVVSLYDINIDPDEQVPLTTSETQQTKHARAALRAIANWTSYD